MLDLLVEAGGDGLPRRFQGERISGKGARVVEEQVARELVEHDDERKRAVGVFSQPLRFPAAAAS